MGRLVEWKSTDKCCTQTFGEVENIKIEPSARTSVPGNPAVQPVHAIDDSNNSIRSDSQNVNREIKVDDVMSKVNGEKRIATAAKPPRNDTEIQGCSGG